MKFYNFMSNKKTGLPNQKIEMNSAKTSAKIEKQGKLSGDFKYKRMTIFRYISSPPRLTVGESYSSLANQI